MFTTVSLFFVIIQGKFCALNTTLVFFFSSKTTIYGKYISYTTELEEHVDATNVSVSVRVISFNERGQLSKFY